MAQPVRYEIVDLASQYTLFWNETRDWPPADRVAAFKTRFEVLLPGFYSAERVGATGEQYDSAIARSFDRFPKIQDRFTAVTSELSRILEPAYASFAQVFPDLKPIGPIYVVHSLGEFDGGTRKIAGELRLLFGADVIARLDERTDQTPFVHHELFHVYHAQYFSECEAVWCVLWSEGLAVFAAQHLNPEATDAELLLTRPRAIRPEVERNRTAAICAVSSRLNSTEGADYASLFSNGTPIADLPPRFGYYVGLLVAAEAAKAAPLAELARLGNEDSRDLVTSIVAKLARCEPQG